MEEEAEAIEGVRLSGKRGKEVGVYTGLPMEEAADLLLLQQEETGAASAFTS